MAFKPQDPIQHLSEIVQELTGVQLGPRSRTMVKSRLQKRILELKLRDEDHYWDYYKAHEAEEKAALVSLLTTHYTFFFREFAHFEHLQAELPNLVKKARDRGDRKIRLWSAACSRGQEAYSLAMFLRYHLARIAPDVEFEIEGSDVDPHSVEIAGNGVYLRDELKSVPLIYQENCWGRGQGEISSYVRAGKELRSRIRFRPGNLLDPRDPGFKTKWDLIFCRNVFIYFNPDQIRESSSHLLSSLHPHGFLYVGLSESLNGLKVDCEMRGPSIYSQPGAKAAEKPAPSLAKPASSDLRPVPAPSPAPAAAARAPQKPLRVLCVDDSPSILTMMKKMLAPSAGFEIAGTAVNGKEAQKFLAANKVDLITLDIHMPEMNGLEFLQSFRGVPPAPVVVVSSVSREQADLALKMLEAGAVDYVEKPELSRFEESRDEIVAKLRTAYHADRERVKASLALDRSFAAALKIQPEKAARVYLFSWPDADRVIASLRECSSSKVPLVLRIDADDSLKNKFREKMERALARKSSPTPTLDPGSVCLLGKTDDVGAMFDRLKGRHTSVCVFGDPTAKVRTKLKAANVHLQYEDLGQSPSAGENAEMVPATSFAALSDQYFAKKAA